MGNALLHNLGVLEAYDENSSAAAINADGQIVGWSLDAAGNKRAFLINPVDSDGDEAADQWYLDEDEDGFNDLMVDLNDLLPSGFAIRLTEARDINASGQIAGWGTTGSGDETLRKAYLLTPAAVAEDGDADDGAAADTSDVDLTPIQGDGPEDETDDADVTAGGELPAFDLLHWLCGVGAISVLPFMLIGLCGLKIALGRARR